MHQKMDSLNFKFHKANSSSILEFRKQGKTTITTLFRFIELCTFLIVIVKFCTNLSGGFLLRVFTVNFISPRFVFLLGNIIVFVIFLKSGQFSDCEATDSSNNSKTNPCSNCEKCGIYEETKVISDVYSHKVRKMRRSYSEKSKRVDYGGWKLKRSVTDIRRRGDKTLDRNRCDSADEMSSEEFRRRIEDFIARRQRSLMEEELSAIVY